MRDSAMTNSGRRGWKTGRRLLIAYLLGNVAIYFVNPFASRWHYRSRKPTPVQVVDSSDDSMSLNQLARVLDEIDLAYGARSPSGLEHIRFGASGVISLLFFPASFVLHMREFIEYIGPATPEQQGFTLSVKQRYNHLAQLAVSKGLQRDGYLYVEEPSLQKQNGASFASLPVEPE